MDGSSIKTAVCCICGLECDFRSAAQLSLKPSYESDEIQHLCSHRSCVRKVIHKSIPLHPDLDDDEEIVEGR